MKEIRIISSRLAEEDKKIRIEFHLEADGKKRTLWFKTSSVWKEFISNELADGVIVTLLIYAIKGGYDIVSDLPVSRALLNRLNNFVIPQLVLCTENSYSTHIICPVEERKFHPDRVATAMSMGIDAFTTFFEYTKDCPPEAERINLLTFMQSGQTSFAEDEDETFAGQLADAERFAQENGYKLLDISSNIYSLYNELFWVEPMVFVSTYRNCGMILLFQKLIKTYYYSASYNLDEFHCSLDEDVTHYEKWLLPNISTASTVFYNSNKAMTRFEKTAYICKNPETYDYLQVCCHHRHSCGVCNKCLRTMFTLEYLGVLENYGNVFDIEQFRKSRKHNLMTLMNYSYNSIDAEVVHLFQREITFGMKSYVRVRAFIFRGKGATDAAKKMFERHPKLKETLRAVQEKI